MTTIVKAANAAQFLSLIPKMLGYRPTRSVVLIPFAGARSIGAMRFDLPDEAESEEIDRIAATLIGMVCRLPEADAVAAVAYTDERFDDDGMPHRDLIEALEKRADACGVRVTDALCVAADAWGSHLDPACPRAGRPLDELGEEPRGAEHLTVAEGDQAAGSELRLSTSPRRSARPARCSHSRTQSSCCAVRSRGLAAFGSAFSSARERRRHPIRIPPTVDASTRRRWPRCARSMTCPRSSRKRSGGMPRRLAPFDAAALVWCLARPALRDIALVQWCGGMSAGDEALDAQLRWESGEEYPAHLAMQMWGEGERPDPDRLEAALALSRRIAAAAPERCAPAPLATCGWLAWALGRSTHAERYALLACEIEPEHGLAEIVRSFVLAGHLPDWAFRTVAGRETSPEAIGPTGSCRHKPSRRRHTLHGGEGGCVDPAPQVAASTRFCGGSGAAPDLGDARSPSARNWSRRAAIAWTGSACRTCRTAPPARARTPRGATG